MASWYAATTSALSTRPAVEHHHHAGHAAIGEVGLGEELLGQRPVIGAIDALQQQGLALLLRQGDGAPRLGEGGRTQWIERRFAPCNRWLIGCILAMAWGSAARGWSSIPAAGDGSTPMCFSSSASFAVAAVLLPLGVGTVRYCHDQQRGDLLPLALTPVLFSIQQALEGLVWLGLEQDGAGWLVHPAALGYLFFAYIFWLAWLPWCVLRLNLHAPPLLRRWSLRILLGLGLLAGAGLWVPLAIDASLIQPAVVMGSLDYQTTLLADRWVNLDLGSTAYGVIILGPLLLSASGRLRWFAAGILGAFLISHLVYGHAFTSVWCFFSALFSASLYWILRDPEPQVLPAGS